MSFLLIYALTFWANCSDTASLPMQTQTELPEPRKVCHMPEELFEISGVTYVDATTVACIQDEAGILYFYDVEQCTVTNTVTFAGAGDFEDVTRVGDTYYILRSDGHLFAVTHLEAKQPRVRELATDVPAADNEGLVYDPQTQQLLIAPKADYHDANFEEKFRAIYAFDLKTGKRAAQPFMQLSVATLTDYLLQQEGLKLERKKKTNEVKLKFAFTALAVHPTEDRVYLLLGPDQLLLTVNRRGEPLAAQSVDKALFPQPEGITLLGDHTLVISSEGKKDGSGSLGLFDLP